MSPLPRDVVQWIEANFPAAGQAEAQARLAGAVDHLGRTPEPRLIRCAVVASRGDLRRLAYYIELLRVDFRDVVVAGEYDVVDGKLVHVRLLDEPMPPTAGTAQKPQSAQ